MFINVDGMRFNENHITYVEAKESSGANGEYYYIEVCCSADHFKGRRHFKTKAECEKYLDKCLAGEYADDDGISATYSSLLKTIATCREEIVEVNEELDPITRDEDIDWDFGDTDEID